MLYYMPFFIMRINKSVNQWACVDVMWGYGDKISRHFNKTLCMFINFEYLHSGCSHFIQNMVARVGLLTKIAHISRSWYADDGSVLFRELSIWTNLSYSSL